MDNKELIQYLHKIVVRDYPSFMCKYEEGFEDGQKDLACDLIKMLSKPPKLYQD